MRVVHLTQSTTAEITGGLEYHVAYLTAALGQRGHEVIVVNTTTVSRGSPVRPVAVSAGTLSARSPAISSPSPAALSHRDGRTPWLPAAIRHDLDSLRETATMFGRRVFRTGHAASVVRFVDDLKPDLVHQHAYLGELGACRLLLRKYPVVFTNHTGAYLHLDRFTPTRLGQRQLMKRFTMVIGPSRELLPRTENSHYVPNGVDTARFFPVAEPERERLKVKHGCVGKTVFLCPRRWAPTKGIVYLARALSHLSHATRGRSVFLFAGNETPGYGKYQEGVQRVLAAATGVEVRTLGNLDPVELAEHMNLAEVCVFPSLMEATSLACLEAMACATPVIGTATGGLLELIRHGENGWLVPTHDERALAERIETIVTAGPGSLRPIRQSALETVRERYTWQAAALETEKIYLAALGKWAGQPSRLQPGTVSV